MTEQIELTSQEQELLNKLDLDRQPSLADHDFERSRAEGEVAAALFTRLLARDAIPKVRLRYFADPTFHPSNPKASRREIFHRHGLTDEEIYRHPHFLAHLRYFIFGANLPDHVKRAFEARLKEIDGDRQLVALARSQYRDLMRNSHSQDDLLPEAFYQLALDCGRPKWEALSIRNAVKAVKITK